MVKSIVVYTYNVILTTPKKERERQRSILNNMDESRHAEWKKPDTKQKTLNDPIEGWEQAKLCGDRNQNSGNLLRFGSICTRKGYEGALLKCTWDFALIRYSRVINNRQLSLKGKFAAYNSRGKRAFHGTRAHTEKHQGPSGGRRSQGMHGQSLYCGFWGKKGVRQEGKFRIG